MVGWDTKHGSLWINRRFLSNYFYLFITSFSCYNQVKLSGFQKNWILVFSSAVFLTAVKCQYLSKRKFIYLPLMHRKNYLPIRQPPPPPATLTSSYLHFFTHNYINKHIFQSKLERKRTYREVYPAWNINGYLSYKTEIR